MHSSPASAALPSATGQKMSALYFFKFLTCMGTLFFALLLVYNIFLNCSVLIREQLRRQTSQPALDGTGVKV